MPPPAKPLAKVFHADLFGARAAKYATLAEQRLADVAWTEVTPSAPFYLFVPQNQDVRAEYEQGWSVKDIFPVNSIGIATGQDKLAVSFAQGDAKLVAQVHHLTEDVVKPILYRPFDTRFVVYDKQLVTRQRTEVMRHIIAGNNLGLGITRGVEAGTQYEHVFVSSTLIDLHTVSMKEVSYFLPLYIYPTPSEHAMGIEKHANLAPAFTQALQARTQTPASPEDIFHYIYALLHSPTYRTRYSEFLKRDFPRLPLPPTQAAFAQAAAVGKTLAAAHLLSLPGLLKDAPAFPHAGTNRVDKLPADKRWQPEALPTQTGTAQTGRIRLNAAQSWEGVSEEVWRFRVGGYQPAAKWLDDRAGRTLSDSDLTHYRKMLAALALTRALLPAADAAFAQVVGA